MKYEKEINEILNFIFPKKYGMTEKQQEVMQTNILGLLNLDKKKLSEDIEKGVKNGYSVEKQIELMKKILTND